MPIQPVHMQSVIQVTLMLLPRLPPGILVLLRASILLLHSLGLHLVHILLIERALLITEWLVASTGISSSSRHFVEVKLTLLLRHGRRTSRVTVGNRLLEDLPPSTGDRAWLSLASRARVTNQRMPVRYLPILLCKRSVNTGAAGMLLCH